jgi:hypothetical protein
LIIIEETGQANARDDLVVVAALAIVAVIGSVRIFCGIRDRLELVGVALWPVVLFALDLYVIVRFLIPFGGL